MKLTFKGGIHPYEGKELTMDKDVIEYVPKGDMVYPLSQHIGAPAKAVVKKGDRVLVGQLIARSRWICFCKHSFFCIRNSQGRGT